MNFVTYETAVRLKEAGFPQPEQKAFQVWYVPHYEKNVPFCLPEKYRLQFTSHCVYAATADDILRELPGFAMYYGEYFYSGKAGFFVFDTLQSRPDQYSAHHENAAEAAALAWFEYFEMERSEFPGNESES